MTGPLLVKRFLNTALRKPEFLWTALGQTFIVLQSFIQTKILATSLTQGQYGEWVLVLSITVLVGMLPFTAVNEAVTSLSGSRERSNRSTDLFAQVFIIYSIIFLVWAVILTVLSATLHGPLSQHLPLFLAFTYTEVLRTASISHDNATRRRRRVALNRSWDLIARSVVLLLVASAHALDITTVLAVLASANSIGLLFSWRKLRAISNVNRRSLAQTFRSLVVFSWPLIIWALFGWLQNMLSRWYLVEWTSSEIVARFAVVVSTATFIPNFMYSVLASYLLPVLFGRGAPFPLRRYLRITAVFASILTAYVFATFLGARYMLLVLTDAKYVDLYSYIPWMSASASIFVLASLYGADLFRARKTRQLLVPSILPGVVALALGPLIIPRFNMIGAIGIFMLGQLVYSVLAVWVTTRHLLRQEKGN